MHRLALSFSIATLALFCASPVEGQIRAEHPRLYFMEGDLERLRVVADTDERIDAMSRYMTRQMADTVARTRSTTRIRGGDYGLMSIAAFVFLVTDRADVGTEAHRYLALLAASDPVAADLLGTRNRLLALAIGYDWLANDLSPTEATAARAAIARYVESLSELLEMPNFVVGTTRWAHVTALAGLLAIHHDDDSLDDVLDVVLDHFVNGYNPAVAVMGVGGGHPMAWYYGSNYAGTEPVMLWRSASESGEIWNADFLRESAYFHLYAANGALDLPLMEDAGNAHLTIDARYQIQMAAMLGNGHAETFAQTLEGADGVAIEPQFAIHRLLTEPDPSTASPIETLPLSRFFAGSGFFVVRDDWDREAATILAFKASPFYSQGHHSRDEGSFVLDYRGPLLVDGGYYDGMTSSTHYRAFSSRTVSHNALLVHGPADPVAPGYPVIDGGQIVRGTEPSDAAALTSSRFRLHGIVGHGDAGACVWARADLSDVYGSKLSAYTRDLLTLRRPDGSLHPMIYVLDRASLASALPSSLLWQFGLAPTREGQTITGSNEAGARVRLDVVRPAAARFQAFSGDDRYRVGVGASSGTYPPDRLTPSQTWPYWGRIEVSPPSDTASPVWSTLIRVGDGELDADTRIPLDVSGSDWVGVRLGNTIAAIASTSTTRVALPAGAPLVDGCIAGLEGGATIEVAVGSAPPITLTADADGIVRYEPGGTTPLDASVGLDAGVVSTDDAGASTTNDGGPRADGAIDVDDDGGVAARTDAGGVSAGPGCGCRAHRARGAWSLFVSVVGLALSITRRRWTRGRRTR